MYFGPKKQYKLELKKQMAKKQDDQEELKQGENNLEQKQKFSITERAKREGYFGKIDGMVVLVQPQTYKNGIDRTTGAKTVIIDSEAELSINGEPVKGSVYDGFNEKQAYQLQVANIIKPL